MNAVAPKQTFIDIHDQYRNGALSKQILAWRAEGVSLEDIAHRLRNDGVDVNTSTVRRWLIDHAQGNGAAGAAS